MSQGGTGQSDSAQPLTEPLLLGFTTCFNVHEHLFEVPNGYHQSLIISILPAPDLMSRWLYQWGGFDWQHVNIL